MENRSGLPRGKRIVEDEEERLRSTGEEDEARLMKFLAGWISRSLFGSLLGILAVW
jgi:hypothetical protein